MKMLFSDIIITVFTTVKITVIRFIVKVINLSKITIEIINLS